ncbi:peroxiredoxin family protein [Isoptericola halotolerans]|uniref:Peroxiredoxin n=1 Tax=Isoptericola halotolerans TaxID=300560 RepID=A0ABX1ZZF8_9MICO|nr:redoxin family protein [Isoptericola halotolerans]NOV95856.1 peroxiredoxin [Isoptericola halotolerans]
MSIDASHHPALGTTLPPLGLVAPDGQRRTLADVLAGRPAVVHFMRSATCPVCLAHAATVQRMHDAGELHGAAFLLLAPGSSPEAATAAGRAARRAPLAEVWATGDHSDVGLQKIALLQHSGTFVVDDGGAVRSARTSALPVSSFSADEVRAALAPR